MLIFFGLSTEINADKRISLDSLLQQLLGFIDLLMWLVAQRPWGIIASVHGLT